MDAASRTSCVTTWGSRLARVVPRAAGRCSRSRQFTDLQIQDSQSPARTEFLERLSDGSNGNDVWTSAGSKKIQFAACYRPQEMLTAQVTEALVVHPSSSLYRVGSLL